MSGADALVYQRYDDAETLFRRALAAYEKHLGADHLYTLASVDNLACVHVFIGCIDDTTTLKHSFSAH